MCRSSNKTIKKVLTVDMPPAEVLMHILDISKYNVVETCQKCNHLIKKPQIVENGCLHRYFKTIGDTI